MIAKFCDRCGKQLTNENVAEFKEVKYMIHLTNYKEAIGWRTLTFCKGCQEVMDYKITNACNEHLPERLVAETKIVKKEDE